MEIADYCHCIFFPHSLPFAVALNWNNLYLTEMALFSCFQFLFSWMPSMRLCSTRFFFSMQKKVVTFEQNAPKSKTQTSVQYAINLFIWMKLICGITDINIFFIFLVYGQISSCQCFLNIHSKKMAISLFFHWIILNDKVDFSTCDYYLQNKRIRPQTSDIGLMLLNVGVFFFSFRSPFPPTFPNTWKLKINIRMKKKNGRLTTEAHKKNAEHVKHPLPRGCCALRTNFYGSPFTLF